jgi:hypothetical protein
MMTNLTSELDAIVRSASSIGNIPVETFYRIIFYSFIKAGLSLYGSAKEQAIQIDDLIKKVPPPYQGLINGKLYLNALRFVKTFNAFLRDERLAVILKEANLRYILEIVSIASKFYSMRRNVMIYEEVFVNPIGVTRFLTGQLETLNRESYLKQYAALLKERLNANECFKWSKVDLVTHQHGYTLEGFLESIEMTKLFDCINHLAKRNSLLITSDHGYDVVADESGLYITHGYKKVCPLNFSRIAPFLVVD